MPKRNEEDHQEHCQDNSYQDPAKHTEDASLQGCDTVSYVVRFITFLKDCNAFIFRVKEPWTALTTHPTHHHTQDDLHLQQHQSKNFQLSHKSEALLLQPKRSVACATSKWRRS